ncbi:MAG: peptide ABC transporter substrate-binding protein [Bacillota bacterium]|uniref:peptide ABC transporter substrate-binding protein n=1 Tax=Rossellomorea sp. FM04394 TaxID=3243076 RepID=UPI0035A5CFEA
MKRKINKYFAFIILCLLLTACNQNATSDVKQGSEDQQVLRLVQTAEMPTLDSSLTTDTVSAQVLASVVEGLFELDEEDNPKPAIAESFDVSEDQKTYTFHLRKDAKWSNGEPVTADDFVYSWRRGVNPDTGAEYAYILYDIKNAEKINTGKSGPDELGVKAIDVHTLEVELEHPVPYFLQLTTLPMFAPLSQEYVEDSGSKYGLEADTTLYNGPFVVKEWKHEQSYLLEKNKHYWDHSEVNLDAIEVDIVKDSSTAINLFNTDEIDQVVLSAELVDQYKESPDFKSFSDSRMFFLRLNQKNPILSKQKARRAIDLAYNKEDLVNVLLNDGSLPAYYFVPKGLTKGPDGKDFRDTVGPLNEGTLKEAQALWKEAMDEENIDSIEVELLNYDTESSRKIGEYIKNQLESNLEGLTIKIKQQPFKQKIELENKMEYEISLSGWSADYPDPMAYLDMLLSESPFNRTGFANEKFDSLILKSKGELLEKPEERWKALQEAEKILFEKMAISPVYQKGVAYLEKGSVENVFIHKFGAQYGYKYAYLEK